MSQEQNMPVEYTAQNDPITAMAERYGMMPQALYSVLRKTAFAAARNNEEFDALCLIAKTYGLNPITREIYAFQSKGGGAVVPIVGVDGYVSLLNRQPDFDGLDFRYADTAVTAGVAKNAPEWVECMIYRKGKSRPVVVREYMDECFRLTEPWKTHPRRMLRHKALCQAVRVAYGFSGVYSDIDEAESVTVAEEKPNVNQAISQAIEAPAQPKRRGRPPKQAQPAPAPEPAPQPEPVQEAPAQDAVAIEAAFDDYIFDTGLDTIKATDVCMRMVKDGVAKDVTDAKRMFVESGMTV